MAVTVTVPSRDSELAAEAVVVISIEVGVVSQFTATLLYWLVGLASLFWEILTQPRLPPGDGQ